MSVEILVGDALSVLRTLPSESVHCCVTSPPYYGLRDYGIAGQIGLEPAPEAYIERMVEVCREVRRVLRDDGTLWLNIGDSYCSGTRSAYGADCKLAARSGKFRRGNPDKNQGNSNRDGVTSPNCKPKDLIGIPWMLAFALRDDGWYLRRDIIWHKPNPMPESVTDRPTSAHEYLFLLTKSARYFYDAEAIKEPFATDPKENYPGRAAILGRGSQASSHAPLGSARRDNTGGYPPNGGGRNKRSVWTIATAPFRGAHFATFPPALVEPCILAGTSDRGVCPKCGAPWERVMTKHPVATVGEIGATTKQRAYRDLGVHHRGGASSTIGRTKPWGPEDGATETIGWRPTCSCNAVAVPATVLDPFFGAGTTGLIAQQHGRSCIGLELNPGYADMARRRLGGKIIQAAA